MTSRDKTKIDQIQLSRLNQGRERHYLEYRRRRLWTATSARTIQALMEQMVLVVLTLLTVHYLPVLNTIVTSHHVMKQLIHSCVPHRLKTIKGSLLPNPPCHPTILVRATLPNALNVINASSVGKLVQLVTASRLILNHKGRVDPMKDECHYQIKH